MNVDQNGEQSSELYFRRARRYFGNWYGDDTSNEHPVFESSPFDKRMFVFTEATNDINLKTMPDRFATAVRYLNNYILRHQLAGLKDVANRSHDKLRKINFFQLLRGA